MRSFSARKLVIGAATLALFGGAAGAVAATQGTAGPSHQSYVADVAKRLGVAPSALTAAMKAARIDRIEAQLASGRITKARADALKRGAQGAAIAPPGHRSSSPGLRGVAAQYLGITPTALRGELRSGTSLAQVAAATPGRSVEGLKAAVMAAARARLEAKVTSGLLTGQQEQKRLDAASRRLDALINRSKVRAAGAKGSRSGKG